MISNPNLILYTCIASGTTILAEFNSKDADLATLALKCLNKTPNYHKSFTHTVHNRSYTFLIGPSFVYFAIYDEKLEYLEALTYLKSVRDAFDVIHLNSEIFSSHNLSPHCFQGEFNPVFHQLLASDFDFEAPSSPREASRISKSANLGLERERKRFVSVSPTSLKKKKKRFGDGDIREGLFENKLDLSDRSLYESSSSEGSFKAKRVWKRHVWVVLGLDFVICLVLFGVWLWICKGFKCIDI